ncbi:COG4315 family predicted lipoprotein [Glycomyces tarimensis]
MRTTSTRRGARAATVLLTASLALAGCGDSDSGSDPGSGYGAPETDTEAPAGAALALSDTSLGPVLADADGMTLYLFTADEGGTPTCYDDCAAAWPPLLTDGEVAVGEDLDESLAGSVAREDGTMQVTYNSHPLYYWAADTEPGDVDGQGVNDLWYVVDAEGNAVIEAR